MDKEKRFEVVYKQGGFAVETKILCDRKTGVCYLWCSSGYAGGLSPLLDASGKPVVLNAQSDAVNWNEFM